MISFFPLSEASLAGSLVPGAVLLPDVPPQPAKEKVMIRVKSSAASL